MPESNPLNSTFLVRVLAPRCLHPRRMRRLRFFSGGSVHPQRGRLLASACSSPALPAAALPDSLAPLWPLSECVLVVRSMVALSHGMRLQFCLPCGACCQSSQSVATRRGRQNKSQSIALKGTARNGERRALSRREAEAAHRQHAGLKPARNVVCTYSSDKSCLFVFVGKPRQLYMNMAGPGPCHRKAYSRRNPKRTRPKSVPLRALLQAVPTVRPRVDDELCLRLPPPTRARGCSLSHPN